MKRSQILGIALVAVSGFAAIAATSASAAPTFLLAEWLINGAAVTTEQNIESVGTVLLEDSKATGGASDVDCSGRLMGTIGADGLDVISEILNLEGNAVISLAALTEPGIACEKLTGICEEPLVWPVNLPWNTLLELMEEGSPVERFFAVLIENSGAGQPGWYVLCMKTITEPHDQCLEPTGGNGIFQLSLEGGTLLLAQFTETFQLLAEEKNVTCEMGGAESGKTESIPQEDVLTEGGTLSASSEEGAGTLEA